MKKVLLIEDNREIATMLFDFFESENIELDYADNGKQGLVLALEHNFDTIILDLMLPKMNGFEVCQKLRSVGKTTPVLMLTALDNKDDLLSGFDCGADDYLTKPFDLDVLKARIFALSRRYNNELAKENLTFADIKINCETREVYRENRPLILTPITFNILELLVRNAPNIVSKEEIIQKIWKNEDFNEEILKSHIYQLRTQLDKPFSFPMLKTVPKIGFRLTNSESASEQ